MIYSLQAQPGGGGVGGEESHIHEVLKIALFFTWVGFQNCGIKQIMVNNSHVFNLSNCSVVFKMY